MSAAILLLKDLKLPNNTNYTLRNDPLLVIKAQELILIFSCLVRFIIEMGSQLHGDISCINIFSFSLTAQNALVANPWSCLARRPFSNCSLRFATNSTLEFCVALIAVKFCQLRSFAKFNRARLGFR